MYGKPKANAPPAEKAKKGGLFLCDKFCAAVSASAEATGELFSLKIAEEEEEEEGGSGSRCIAWEQSQKGRRSIGPRTPLGQRQGKKRSGE